MTAVTAYSRRRLTSTGMASTTGQARPAQQARSRAAVARLLEAAEQVLVEDGLSDFTIAAVAKKASMSVGGVYGRFDSKDQLIAAVRDNLMAGLEQAVQTSLAAADPNLPAVIAAFTGALAETFARSGKVAPTIFSAEKTADVAARGLVTLTAITGWFHAATAHYHDRIPSEDPAAELDFVLRSIMATGIHRAAVMPRWPDGLTWTQWADKITDMMVGYLTVGSPSAP